MDALLRKYGYQIHARQNHKEPVWILNGMIFRQKEALLRITPTEKADALMLEGMDAEGFF